MARSRHRVADYLVSASRHRLTGVRDALMAVVGMQNHRRLALCTLLHAVREMQAGAL